MQESSFLSMLGTDTGDWMDKYQIFTSGGPRRHLIKPRFSKESDRIVFHRIFIIRQQGRFFTAAGKPERNTICN